MARFLSPSFPFLRTMAGFIRPFASLFLFPTDWHADPVGYRGEPPAAVCMIKATSMEAASVPGTVKPPYNPGFYLFKSSYVGPI